MLLTDYTSKLLNWEDAIITNVKILQTGFTAIPNCPERYISVHLRNSIYRVIHFEILSISTGSFSWIGV